MNLSKRLRRLEKVNKPKEKREKELNIKNRK